MNIDWNKIVIYAGFAILLLATVTGCANAASTTRSETYYVSDWGEVSYFPNTKGCSAELVYNSGHAFFFNEHSVGFYAPMTTHGAGQVYPATIRFFHANGAAMDYVRNMTHTMRTYRTTFDAFLQAEFRKAAAVQIWVPGHGTSGYRTLYGSWDLIDKVPECNAVYRKVSQ